MFQKMVCLWLVVFIGAYGCMTVDQKGNRLNRSEEKAVTLVQPDGSYPAKPLEKEKIVVKVVQSGVKSLADFPTVQEGLDYNLNHMLSLGRQACEEGKKPDFILYHEFPLTGYHPGSRAEKLKFTVTIPGPETDRLGKLAKACDAYIIFGSYARDDDWPDHILSLNTVIGRDGKVVKKYWKSRNIKRLYADREITTTTIEAVRDKYRAKYGIDEEFPVLQTEFGNIAVSTVQFDPFIFAAFAMKGTEIMFRTATLFDESDVISNAWTHNYYSAMSNITLPEGLPYRGGNSVIVSPKGDILARDPSTSKDDIIEAEIPITEFRKGRKIPNYALEMVQPVFQQYQQEIPLNHLDLPVDQFPKTGPEMKDHFDRISRFLNKE